MQRAAMHRQRRNLKPDFRTVLQIHPSRRLPSLDGQIWHSIGASFCPHRLASIYNLSIRYWDEGCVRLAARTLQGALQILQQQGLWGGCVAHTWDSMEILRGSKQLRHADPTCAAPPHTDPSRRKLDIKDRYLRSRVFFSRRMFVAAGKLALYALEEPLYPFVHTSKLPKALKIFPPSVQISTSPVNAERELEEVRGHLGSLLCRASLRGYGSAVSNEAVRRCSRIK